MKKIFTLTFLVLTLTVHSQKLKDKLNAAVDKASGAPAAVSSTTGLTSNQYEMIEPFTKSPKLWYSELKNGVVESTFISETSTGLGDFTRDEAGKVVSVKGYMTPDFVEFPKSYIGSRRDMQVFFIQDYCFLLALDGTVIAKPEDVDKLINWDGIFDRIISLNKESAKSITFEKAKELIKNYLTEVQKGVDAINTKKAEEAEALRKIYSIKDKKVKSVTIESSQEYLRYLEYGAYTVVATLEDGTVIKAGPGEKGYLDDYNVVVTGIEGGEPGMVYNKYKPTPTDKVTLTVTSKYHPGKTATKVYKMKYEIADMSGGEGEFTFENRVSGPPYNGIDTRVEIKQVKNSISGEILLEYRIFDMGGTKPHFVFRCTPDTPVEMGAHGRRITSEAKGIGQTGGDGGKIKVIVDPSITVSYNYTSNVKGARGQDGEAGEGSPGRDGSVEIVKQKVSF
ncbi:MAG: hypothetical protein V4638_07195 [Bacteroidota bacterium]